jgi:hypothetical protein
MNTTDEDQRLAETRRKLKRLMENSTGQVGPAFVWNREEIYADRIFPRHPKPDPDRSGKKE